MYLDCFEEMSSSIICIRVTNKIRDELSLDGLLLGKEITLVVEW